MLGLLGLVAVAACHFALARALCRWAGEPSLSIAAALALALLYALPATITRALPAFVPATLIAAGFALALALVVVRFGRPAPMRPAAASTPWSWPSRALTLLVLVLVVWATIGTRLWDETNAHFGLVRMVARGVVPPPHPMFPHEPFRYHYAFDVLGALPNAFLGLRTDFSIDVATIACWMVLVAVCRRIGAELGGARGASLAVLLIPLGSGLFQIFLFQDFYLLGPRWDAIPSAWGASMPPPVISNFFQHPQGLGMSLALAVGALIATDDPDRSTQRRRFAVGALLLGLLSLGQIVFFGVGGLMAGVVVVVRTIRDRRAGRLARAGLELGMLVGSLAIAVGLGGFLATGPRPDNVLVLGRTYFGDGWPTAVVHHLVVFGLPLAAMPLAMWARRREWTELRTFLAGAALVGLLVPNVMSYERSWDIVKFFGVGAFFANALLVDWAVSLRPSRWITAAIVGVATPAAWVWLLRMSAMNGVLDIHPMQFGRPSEIAVATTAFLDPRVAPRERVFSTNMDLPMAGGFLTPGFRWREHGESYMMDRDEADRLTQHHESARHHLRRADLEGLGVRWVVLSDGDIQSLSDEGRRALDDASLLLKAQEVRAGNSVRHVYRVVPIAPAARP